MRLAIVEDNKLAELDIDLPSKNIKSNIYKGTISRVEPSLEAAFVNFGRSRHGFLPFKEISQDIFTPGKQKTSRDCIESGKEIVVQIDKEERVTKGAALTTYLSLAGKYLVLLPKNPNTGGVSRRLEGNDRMAAKKLLSDMNIPDGMSIIMRTSGLDTNKETLEWDMNYLIQIYESILENSVLKKAPFLIYQESSMLARVIRDYVDESINEVIIDDKKFYDDFMNAKEHFIPHSKVKVEHYTKPVPIFSNFGIETQLQSVYRKKVTLPSGGNIVFDTTEALTSIDVNSAKSTKGGDIEETALNTNLEAAASLIWILTNHEAQMHEARGGKLPTMTRVWTDIASEMDAAGNEFMSDLFSTFSASMAEDAFTPPLIPEWIPFSNIIFPELQAAIVGDKTVKEALDAAAKETDYLMQDAGYY